MSSTTGPKKTSPYEQWLREGKYLTIKGVRWEVTLEARPGWCDRGRYYAKAFGPPMENTHGWPRHYFRLEHAMDEIREWLKIRHDLLPDSHFSPKEF
jgi:hypothetical protein